MNQPQENESKKLTEAATDSQPSSHKKQSHSRPTQQQQEHHTGGSEGGSGGGGGGHQQRLLQRLSDPPERLQGLKKREFHVAPTAGLNGSVAVRRREPTYDDLHDPHLAPFWARQGLLLEKLETDKAQRKKAKRDEKRQRREQRKKIEERRQAEIEALSAEGGATSDSAKPMKQAAGTSQIKLTCYASTKDAKQPMASVKKPNLSETKKASAASASQNKAASSTDTPPPPVKNQTSNGATVAGISPRPNQDSNTNKGPVKPAGVATKTPGRHPPSSNADNSSSSSRRRTSHATTRTKYDFQ